MLARIRKSMDEKDQGFTLIELLVVMIIIGILAAIAIPVFLNQRAKAHDTATKADVTGIAKELATYFVDNTVAPTVTIPTGTTNYVITPGAGATSSTAITVGRQSESTIGTLHANFNTTTPNLKWCVDLTNSAGSTQSWKYSAANGLQSGLCGASDIA